MTILAGILSGNPDYPVTEQMRDILLGRLSRHPGDVPESLITPYCVIAKIDIGAYGNSGLHRAENGSISMLAGEPLLAHRGDAPAGTRTSDLHAIHHACERSDWNVLARATGAYTAIHYAPQSKQLTLIADKLCIRPLYYFAGNQYFVFASALRILEGLSWVPRVMDLRAVTERITLGVPLASRTPYQAIQLMEAGQIIQVAPQRLHASYYWKWDEVPPTRLEEKSLLKEAAARFTRAVRRRSREDRSTTSFLSGGLDSRCIVAVLRDLGIDVATYNLAPPDTLDQALGAQFARHVGTRHHECPMDPDQEAKFSTTLANALRQPHQPTQPQPARPQLVWSGDGGSVSVGHVYMTPEVVARLRTGQLDEAVQMYLAKENAIILRRLMHPRVFAELEPVPREGVLHELKQLHAPDAARNFYLYLMLNDQRRHLAEHFEYIDLHRLEFHLPFYDSDFIELMVSSPIDLCLQHRFYNRWLSYLPATVAELPWQAYPGHEPCPLPVPSNLTYQWGKDTYFSAHHKRQKATLIRETLLLLSSDDFPHALLRKTNLRLATLAYRLGLRDYGYVLKIAKQYYTSLRQCAGKYTLPPLR